MVLQQDCMFTAHLLFIKRKQPLQQTKQKKKVPLGNVLPHSGSMKIKYEV